MLNSFKQKILAGFLLITLLCTIVLTSVALIESKKIATNQMKKDGITIVNIVKKNLSNTKIENTQEMSTILKDIKKDSGDDIVYLSVCDTTFKLIAHNDDNLINNQVEDKSSFEEALKEGRAAGAIFTRPTGDTVYNVSTPFYENGKIVGLVNVGISLNSMNALIREGLTQTLFIGLIALLISIIIGVLISRNISRPIENIVTKMDNISDGDFTVEFHPKGHDEISKLMTSLNKTMEVTRNLISRIKDEVINIDGVAQNLSASTEENEASSSQINDSITELSQSALQQAQQISEATESLIHFGEILDKINSKVMDLANSSSNIETSAHDGSKKIDKLIDSVNDIKETFVSVSERISSLNGSVLKISEITDVINQIAEQTNLLALNASIEAARAGEAGRGFAVVAEEIQKLAEQVLYSSKNIHSLVETVTNNTKQVSYTTQNVSEKIQVQAKSIEDTMDSFKNILQEVEKITPHIEEVSEKLNITTTRKDSIFKNIETISSISEEFSASTEEISASMEQQLSSTQEVSASAQSLTELADRLENMVESLKVSSEA